MRIGILTFHWSSNYGAVVQAIALSQILERLGHESIIIDRQRVYKGILRKLYHKFSFKHKISWNRFWLENMKYLRTTKTYYNTKSMQSCVTENNLNAVVVGSDQVWRWLDIADYNYFLDFVHDKNCKKISYAASFGFSKWPYGDEQTEHVKSLIARFDKISVREESGVKICKEVFEKEATLVLDPTMLNDADFYIDYFSLNRREASIVVSYTLGDNQSDLLSIYNFALNQGLEHRELYLLKSDVVKACKKSCPYTHYTLKEWLDYILNAKIVVTSSFHATVFAILFHKDFYVMKNQSGGLDRIITLLGSLGLEDRVVDNLKNVNVKAINYEIVDTRLNDLRNKSINYLNDSLLKNE